jgi:hypothetical protein
MTLRERFDKYAPSGPAEQCWLWTGTINAAPNMGYGLISYREHSGPGASRVPPTCLYAHRLAYEFAKGPIPDGLTVDHICFNRLCINPAHLEAVSLAENTRRRNARRSVGGRYV